MSFNIILKAGLTSGRFASQKEAFISLMSAELTSSESALDKNGFHVLNASELCHVEIDPDLDQEKRIQLALEAFEESLKNIPG